MIISVVIPTRNRAPLLKRVLDSLLADDYPHKEIIVCDGASTDGTVDLLKSYGDRIRWISERDKGEYDARNKGLQLVTGEIIRYLSDDDVPLPGSFAYARQYFLDHPKTDILFGQSMQFYIRVDGEKTIYDARPRTADSIKLGNFVCGYAPNINSETAFFHRRVIDRIGLFDLSFRAADYEYWARAAKAGLQMAICDQLFIHYYISELSGVERFYLQIILERWKIASRYGTWGDKLYVVSYFIPRSLLRYILHKLLSPSRFYAMRKTIIGRFRGIGA